MPDSELPHELVLSPLDLKATLGVGIIPMFHLARPTLGRVITMSEICEEMRRVGSLRREREKKSDHAQASCSIVHIFSV